MCVVTLLQIYCWLWWWRILKVFGIGVSRRVRVWWHLFWLAVASAMVYTRYCVVSLNWPILQKLRWKCSNEERTVLKDVICLFFFYRSGNSFIVCAGMNVKNWTICLIRAWESNGSFTMPHQLQCRLVVTPATLDFPAECCQHRADTNGVMSLALRVS